MTKLEPFLIWLSVMDQKPQRKSTNKENNITSLMFLQRENTPKMEISLSITSKANGTNQKEWKHTQDMTLTKIRLITLTQSLKWKARMKKIEFYNTKDHQKWKKKNTVHVRIKKGTIMDTFIIIKNKADLPITGMREVKQISSQKNKNIMHNSFVQSHPIENLSIQLILSSTIEIVREITLYVQDSTKSKMKRVVKKKWFLFLCKVWKTILNKNQ